MRARIEYSPAPHEPKWYAALLQPAIALNNAVLAAFMYPGWRMAQHFWDPELEGLMALLRDRTSPVIIYGWHADMLLTACAFRDLPDELMPLGIGNDGFRSRAVQQTANWFRIPVWAYRRGSSVPPKQQITELLAGSRRIVALFADGGGRDGKMKPGFIEVARATGTRLLPMVVTSEPNLTLRVPNKLCFPLPFSRLGIHWDEPIAGEEATLDVCRAALERLQARADARQAGE